MSRYDGLIIPRSYSEYINKTDAATLQQALQLNNVLAQNVAANDNRAVTSNAVNTKLNLKLEDYVKTADIADKVESGNMNAVTSNAVNGAINNIPYVKNNSKGIHEIGLSYTDKLMCKVDATNFDVALMTNIIRKGVRVGSDFNTESRNLSDGVYLYLSNLHIFSGTNERKGMYIINADINNPQYNNVKTFLNDESIDSITISKDSNCTFSVKSNNLFRGVLIRISDNI